MACSPSGGVVLENDDDRYSMEALLRDPTLVAELLLLSRPKRMKWGRRRSRSRCITQEGIRAARMEEEAARRASPATPLSWSGGGTSGTSGSVCGGSPHVPLERKKKKKKKRSAHEDGSMKRKPGKRSKPEAHRGGEPPQLVLPSKSPELGTVPVGGVTRSDSVVCSAAAVGPSSTSASDKGVEFAASVRQPSRLRFTLRLPAKGAGSAADAPPKKKKKLAELQAVRDSLLQEQEGLRKELEKEKEIYDALLKESMTLNELESRLSSDTAVSRPASKQIICEEAKLEQPQCLPSIPDSQTVTRPYKAATREEEGRPESPQCKTSSSSSALWRVYPFDLNCTPGDEL